MLIHGRSFVLCALCDEAILSREDLFTVSLWFRIKPYHRACYEQKFRDARKSYYEKMPVNSSSYKSTVIGVGLLGMLFFSLITGWLDLVLKDPEMPLYVIPAGIMALVILVGPCFIPAVIRYISWIRYERELPK